MTNPTSNQAADQAAGVVLDLLDALGVCRDLDVQVLDDDQISVRYTLYDDLADEHQQLRDAIWCARCTVVDAQPDMIGDQPAHCLTVQIPYPLGAGARVVDIGYDGQQTGWRGQVVDPYGDGCLYVLVDGQADLAGPIDSDPSYTWRIDRAWLAGQAA